MTIVRKVEGSWEAARGVVTLSRLVATRTVTYQDGRAEEEACEPYAVPFTLDMGNVARLVAAGTWSASDLEPFGLVEAQPFEVPEGKQIVGAPSYVEADGVVSEVYEIEDIPPPPAPPTAEEKLAAAGLSMEEFDALIAASIGRQAGA